MTTITHEMVNTRLTMALERTWRVIRKAHPDVPPVVITVGSGIEKTGLKYGHFAAVSWKHKNSDGDHAVSELFIGGEGLQRDPAAVLATLLHEAAHGIAFTRGIKDTSRQGRYHNTKFKAIAEELGLEVTDKPGIGWSGTTATKATRRLYRRYIDVLGRALVVWRPTELAEPKTTNNNGLSVTCECPRRFRISQKAYDEGPILCGNCDTAFTPDNNTDNDTDEG